MIKRMAAMVCVCGLLLGGCGDAGVTGSTEAIDKNNGTAASWESNTDHGDQETTLETEQGTEQETVRENGGSTVLQPGGSAGPVYSGTQELMEGKLAFSHVRTQRITYTGDRSFVRYITSADALAHYDADALKQYDDAYFKDKALVLICETVGSGSVRMGVESVTKEGDQIRVTLSHELEGEGTADMATWLIWAEVDAGLEQYRWILTNSKTESGGEIK